MILFLYSWMIWRGCVIVGRWAGSRMVLPLVGQHVYSHHAVSSLRQISQLKTTNMTCVSPTYTVLLNDVCLLCNLDFCPFPFWGLFFIKVVYQRIHAIGMYEVVFFLLLAVFRRICTACATVICPPLLPFACFSSFPSSFFFYSLLLQRIKQRLCHGPRV